eukprot:scaffold8263_cov104-Isochrysis_galbana.AAC.2
MEVEEPRMRQGSAWRARPRPLALAPSPRELCKAHSSIASGHTHIDRAGRAHPERRACTLADAPPSAHASLRSITICLVKLAAHIRSARSISSAALAIACSCSSKCIRYDVYTRSRAAIASRCGLARQPVSGGDASSVAAFDASAPCTGGATPGSWPSVADARASSAGARSSRKGVPAHVCALNGRPVMGGSSEAAAASWRA